MVKNPAGFLPHALSMPATLNFLVAFQAGLSNVV